MSGNANPKLMESSWNVPRASKIVDMPPVNQKLDQLTTSRFFAALSVVLYHGWRKLGILSYLPMFTWGPNAVSYFYVLSGFVMMLAYYRPEKQFNIRHYAIARFARIYPVYILSFALTCLYYLDILAKIKPGKIWANIFLYQAWIPSYALSFNIVAWSLSVEVFFYILFPLLAIVFSRVSAQQVLWASFGVWILSQAVHATMFTMLMPEQANLLNYLPLFHLNSFLLGAAGGLWYMTLSDRQNIDQTANRVILLGSLGLVLLVHSFREYLPGFPHGFSLDAGLLAPLFLLIVLGLARDSTRLSSGLSHPWLVTLGDASYALYILHLPYLWLLKRLLEIMGVTLSEAATFLIYFPTLLVLCLLVFKYIEKPARDWLRTNSQMLPAILLDLLLIPATIGLCFSLRLGSQAESFARTQSFAMRVGIASFFIFLVVFRFYSTNSRRSLALAVLSGAIVLASFMYLAWMSGWVEGFPRSILILIPILVFASIYLSRLLAHSLKFKFLKIAKLIQ